MFDAEIQPFSDNRCAMAVLDCIVQMQINERG
jgi:hypothetical protein